jgi:aminoglycoside/choline kinase family phosphotransferase
LPMDPRIDGYLVETGLATSVAKVVPLTGDASDRKYFRVIGTDGHTQVLALHVGPIDFATLPFVNVCELFQQMPLPVPAILGHSDALGILALRDLGDVTLQAHLGAATPAAHAGLYREAVSLIARMQRQGAELASDRYLPYRIAFDVEKLTWELNFFVKHFLEGYRGVALTPSERTALDEEWAVLTNELASERRVLCHRDYHSRNLMFCDGSLHIIDFQDARMGPDTYDLASLLRDSYVDLTDTQVEELVAYFLALTGQANAGEFRRRYDVMSLQRNLKALGTFGYQTISRQNPVYIQYMPRTLNYVRANLARHGRFGRLRELLSRHVDELR